MVFVFEIMGIIFLIIMIYFTYLDYKRNRLSKKSFLFWFIAWGGGIVLVLGNQYVSIILPTLSIFRVLDLYMIIAFMFLFAIIFYLFRVIKNTEKRVEEVVRKVAINLLGEKAKTN